MAAEQQAPRNWKVPFFSLWIGQAASLLGSSVAAFALVWWLTEKTGSAVVLATASTMTLLPGIFLGPFAGALVDRWNRRAVMIISDCCTALLSAWLAYLFLAGTIQPWHIYVIALGRSLGGAFQWPAMEASTSLMVPKEQLSRVAGLNQTLNGALGIIAAPVGAFLISVVPFYTVMGLDVCTAALGVLPLFFIRVPQPLRKSTAAGSTALLRDVREGLRYVWGWPGIVLLMGTATIVNLLFYPAFSLLPLLVTQQLGGQAAELGWLDSIWGVGMVAGGLLLSIWGGFRRRVATTLVGLIFMGLCTLALGFTPAGAFGVALTAMFLLGATNPITNGPLQAVLQAHVAPEMQGRVFTLLSSLSSAASPIGLALAAPVADLLGVRVWYWVGGVVCTLLAVAGLLTPAVMHVEDQAAAPAEAEGAGEAPLMGDLNPEP